MLGYARIRQDTPGYARIRWDMLGYARIRKILGGSERLCGDFSFLSLCLLFLPSLSVPLSSFLTSSLTLCLCPSPPLPVSPLPSPLLFSLVLSAVVYLLFSAKSQTLAGAGVRVDAF